MYCLVTQILPKYTVKLTNRMVKINRKMEKLENGNGEI